MPWEGGIRTLKMSQPQGPGVQVYVRLRMSQDKTEHYNHQLSKHCVVNSNSATGIEMHLKARSAALKPSSTPAPTITEHPKRNLKPVQGEDDHSNNVINH